MFQACPLELSGCYSQATRRKWVYVQVDVDARRKNTKQHGTDVATPFREHLQNTNSMQAILTPIRRLTSAPTDTTDKSPSSHPTWELGTCLLNLREPRAPRPITGEYSLRSRPSASGWANGNAASPNSTTGASRLIDRRRWRSVCNIYILHVMSAAPHTPHIQSSLEMDLQRSMLIPGTVSSVRACKIYPVVFFNK